MLPWVNDFSMWLLIVGLVWAEPADRVLYVVGSRIVTHSDVVFERFFDPADLSPVPAFEDPSVPLPERLRDMAVVRQLAGDTAIFRPDPAEVRARADALLSHWPRAEDGLAAFRSWGMDETALLGFLYSRIVAERLVLRSLPPPRADASEAERADWARRYAGWIAEARGRVEIRVPPVTPGEP
jgi:hypothetical protein